VRLQLARQCRRGAVGALRAKLGNVQQAYPLATLYEARQRAAERAEDLLVQRCREYDGAVQRQALASERLAAARDRALAQARQQLELAQHGLAAVGDLQAGAAYRRGADIEFERLMREQERLSSMVAQCGVLLDQAKRGVVLARQELAIVERHRQNYHAMLRKVEELRNDEHAAEVWQANQHSRPPAGLK
jgi:hypothetical protein